MLGEVLGCLGLGGAEETVGFKCIVMGDKGVYIEGVRNVVKFSEEEIVIKLKSKRAVITGAGLSIKHLTDSDAVVSGSIAAVEFFGDKLHG